MTFPGFSIGSSAVVSANVSPSSAVRLTSLGRFENELDSISYRIDRRLDPLEIRLELDSGSGFSRPSIAIFGGSNDALFAADWGCSESLRNAVIALLQRRTPRVTIRVPRGCMTDYMHDVDKRHEAFERAIMGPNGGGGGGAPSVSSARVTTTSGLEPATSPKPVALVPSTSGWRPEGENWVPRHELEQAKRELETARDALDSLRRHANEATARANRLADEAGGLRHDRDRLILQNHEARREFENLQRKVKR